MAGQKLSAKTEEELAFLEHLLVECDHIASKTEEYSSAYKGESDLITAIARQLAKMRQRAMMKNLGTIGDQAGMLAVAAGSGSKMQRCRVLREGIGSYKQLIARTMKAMADADARHFAQAAREQQDRRAEEHEAATRMAERVLRESSAAKRAPVEPAQAARPKAPAAGAAAAPRPAQPARPAAQPARPAAQPGAAAKPAAAPARPAPQPAVAPKPSAAPTRPAASPGAAKPLAAPVRPAPRPGPAPTPSTEPLWPGAPPSPSHPKAGS
jgi:hypothetical protein